jgi:hypothetical protein
MAWLGSQHVLQVMTCIAALSGLLMLLRIGVDRSGIPW